MSQGQFDVVQMLFWMGYFALQVVLRRRARPGEPPRPGTLGPSSWLFFTGFFILVYVYILVDNRVRGIDQYPIAGFEVVVLVAFLGIAGGSVLLTRRERARRLRE